MIHVLDNITQMSEQAAHLFVKLANEAIAAKGKFVVALTGGSSPEGLYTMLAGQPFSDQIDWNKVFVFWGDERWVPLTDDKSNAKMADRTLLLHVPIPKDQIFYMWANQTGPEEFALKYERSIRNVLGDNLSFDLILLGMGPDGHTASLFPHEPVLNEQHKLVAAYFLQSQNMHRITLTAPIINAAQHIVFMIYGENKADALHEVLEGERNTELYPSQLIKPVKGDITWLVDKAAAAKLKSHNR